MAAMRPGEKGSVSACLAVTPNSNMASSWGGGGGVVRLWFTFGCRYNIIGSTVCREGFGVPLVVGNYAHLHDMQKADYAVLL